MGRGYHIEKRTRADGSTAYRVQVRVQGAPPATATKDRKRDAERWGRAEAERLRELVRKPALSRVKTVADALDRYETIHLPDLGAVTQAKRLIRLRWWRARLGPVVLADLTTAMVREAVDRLAAGDSPSGKPVKRATVHRYLAALQRVCALAVREWQWLDRNPVQAIVRHAEPQTADRVPTRDEWERLLAACRAESPRLALWAVLAVSTGMRAGEVERLRWADLDLERRVALIRTAKGGKPRTVPLVAPLVEELRRYREAVPRRLDDDRVMVEGSGARWPRAEWDRARAAAGLPWCKLHTLRHTTATWLLMSGASIEDVRVIMGHASIVTTQRYLHVAQNHSQQVADRMAERWLR